mgnify:CR=1 FL=1
MNIKTPRYEPRFKMIRNEKNFDSAHFIADIANLAFSLVYAVEEADEKLEILNNLLLSIIDKHAQTKNDII